MNEIHPPTGADEVRFEEELGTQEQLQQFSQEAPQSVRETPQDREVEDAMHRDQ